MLVLLAVLVLVGGFALRLNPLMVVVAAALAAGVLAAAGAGGVSPPALCAALVRTIETLGHEFARVRYVSVIWLILPVIGLLEREGLQARARRMIVRIRAATVGAAADRLFPAAAGTAALRPDRHDGPRPDRASAARAHGRGRAGGQGRPADRQGALSPARLGGGDGQHRRLLRRGHVRGRVLDPADLGVLQGMGVKVQPIQLSLWAIPSAAVRLAVHGVRLLRLDRRLERELKAEREAGE